ncbi:hypothetical protein BCR34DRAFT_598789 [Clohesyomyces aquaticus]|uniref:Fungal N-terminal domain-containing protein n=1 Tax=Clohesyomyces aquaticus TaxID=1231657 RepID=A0A1Y1ZXT0_9PLEO|nr:hypothetical protein BCR34DRAFT_598789 [Clohesyomyces aquaticus]
MGDVLGGLISLGHLVQKAYTLYAACQAAPEEIRLAGDHVHGMALVLDGVKSDLVDNRNSSLYKTTAIAQTRKRALQIHVEHCDRSLARMEKLLSKYHGFKKTHVSGWDRFRWSMDGKKEIADCKADLVLATSILDLFLSKEGLSVLWRVESTMEIILKKIGALELFQANMLTGPTTRGRSGSNVGRTIVLSLVITKFKSFLRRYRRRKANTTRRNRPNQVSKRPKPITRQSSGFAPNKKRDGLIQNYAWSNIANASTVVGGSSQRSQTPPPIYNDPTGERRPGLTRRSSSMRRLMNRINAQSARTKSDREHFECWKVGIGKLAFGGKTAPEFLPHKRGQLQLRKMGEIYKEAAMYDYRAPNEQDKRVRLLLDAKNSKEKNNKTGRKWYLAGAKVIARDPGRTGMVVVEKAMVVLVRRTAR